jgi:hypothetical protein
VKKSLYKKFRHYISKEVHVFEKYTCNLDNFRIDFVPYTGHSNNMAQPQESRATQTRAQAQLQAYAQEISLKKTAHN